MKKIHVLIPTIATISFMPLVGLVGCGKDELTELCFENDNNDDKVSNIQYEAHLVTNSDRDIEYKYDNGKWQDWTIAEVQDATAVSEKLAIKKGQKLYVRNNANEFSSGNNNYINFKIDADNKIKASGNVNSLINNNGALSNYCFYKLFNDCLGLTKAPELPATTLAENCYSYMFYGCSSLSTPPQLPATTLTKGCYQNMFGNCGALTVAPTLPAKDIAEVCYFRMFRNCDSLTTPPKLPATELANSCYFYMFEDCDKMIQATELPAKALKTDCYRNMFANTSIKITTEGTTDKSHIVFKCPEYDKKEVQTPVLDMFKNITSDPVASKTYYWVEQ